MHERVVANWLTSANELAYTLPFCQVLAAQGMSIIKVSPKKATNEQGKDIIAVDRSGKPHCYQLKGGNITLTDWRNEIKGQIESLLDNRPVHPSLGEFDDWASYLVLNGELMGEATQEIEDYIKTRKSQGRTTPTIITIGQLEKDFNRHFATFMPTELSQFEKFLDLYNTPGHDVIDLPKHSGFWRLYFVNYLSDQPHAKINKNAVRQKINASLVINSYILGKKYGEENNMAIIQGWLVLLQTIYAIAERYLLDDKYFDKTASLIKAEVYERNRDLVGDILNVGLFDRSNGTAVSETLIFRQRFSHSVTFSSLITMAEIADGNTVQVQHELHSWITENAAHLRVETEADIPGMLCLVFILLMSKNPEQGEQLLGVLFKAVIDASYSSGLPDPYHDFMQVLKHRLGIRLLDNIDETFKRSSYTLSPFVLVMSFLGMRPLLGAYWRKISHIQSRQFIPSKPWMYFLRLSAKGTLTTKFFQSEQSWAELVQRSKAQPDGVPRILAENISNIFLLWSIYPHRFNDELTQAFLASPLMDETAL